MRWFVVLNFIFLFSVVAQISIDSTDYYREKLEDSYSLSIDSTLYFYNRLIEKSALEQKANLFRKKGLFLINRNLNKAAERELLKALEIVENNDFLL